MTSNCAGSGFSFIVKSLEHEVKCREFDLDTAKGGGKLKGWMQAEETLLRREAGGEDEEADREDFGAPRDDGKVFLTDLIENAQGWPCLAMTSLRVSIGEPLTDHSVIPI